MKFIFKKCKIKEKFILTPKKVKSILYNDYYGSYIPSKNIVEIQYNKIISFLKFGYSLSKKYPILLSFSTKNIINKNGEMAERVIASDLKSEEC